MKYRSKLYAKALAGLLLGKHADQKKIVAKFFEYLVKNGDLKRGKEIMQLTEREMLQQSGNKKIILETARTVDIKNFTKSFLKGDTIEQKISPELIAGIKIIINDEQQFDNSLLKKLNSI